MKEIELEDYYYGVTICGSFGKGDGFDYDGDITIYSDEMRQILEQVEKTGEIPEELEDLPEEIRSRLMEEADEQATESYEYWDEDHAEEIDEEMKKKEEVIRASVKIDREKDPEGWQEAYDGAYEFARDLLAAELRSNWKFTDDFSLYISLPNEFTDDIVRLAEEAGIIEPDDQ